MNADIHAEPVAQLFLLREEETCVHGECEERTNIAIQIALVGEDGSEFERVLPVCRLHLWSLLEELLPGQIYGEGHKSPPAN